MGKDVVEALCVGDIPANDEGEREEDEVSETLRYGTH
jgi:hypothetical protein